MDWSRLGTFAGRLFGGTETGRYVIPGSLTGTFELSADRLFGEVVDENEMKNTPIQVTVKRAGKTILATDAHRIGQSNKHHFELPTQHSFDTAELISGTVQVIASTAQGHSGTIRLNGATELELVREHLGVPVETICDIYFTEQGNLRDYIGAGWSGPEAQSTWTEDDDSFLSLPTIAKAGDYALRLTSGAMVSAPACPGQNVELHLNDELIWQQYISFSHPQFFEIKFDGAPFLGRSLQLRIHHPNALRLADHNATADPHRLALSVKRLALVHFKK